MYNARIFYNISNGTVLRSQTLNGGLPLPIEDEIAIVLQTSDVGAENLGYFEWTDPENELERLIADGKIVKIDVTQTPHVLYGQTQELS